MATSVIKWLRSLGKREEAPPAEPKKTLEEVRAETRRELDEYEAERMARRPRWRDWKPQWLTHGFVAWAYSHDRERAKLASLEHALIFQPPRPDEPIFVLDRSEFEFRFSQVAPTGALVRDGDGRLYVNGRPARDVAVLSVEEWRARGWPIDDDWAFPMDTCIRCNGKDYRLPEEASRMVQEWDAKHAAEAAPEAPHAE